MRTISSNKRQILSILEKDVAGYDLEELDGYLIQEDENCQKMITRPAPEGEPARYNPKTNTGVRRFVCWA